MKKLVNGVLVDLTPEEINERSQILDDADEEKRLREFEDFRQNIKNSLQAIDLRSIRALREGNAQRVAELEAEADVLRQQLAAQEA